MVGTGLMTVVMERLHRRLNVREAYPLPPREITETLLPSASSERLPLLTMLAHFGFGGAAGALLGGYRVRPTASLGALFGITVWTASYLGWIPLAGILKPATQHPPKRNGLMIMAHLVWGTTTAVVLRSLLSAREESFGYAGASARKQANMTERDRMPDRSEPDLL
jgi:hypothetical protein